jgi:hypothetical protein
VVLFYGLLVAWTVVVAVLIGSSIADAQTVNVVKLLMITFILVYTWYFSVAISYRIVIDAQGTIELTSFRRTVTTSAEDIPMVEGPHFPIGFMRFRLEREKGYLFCVVNNESLKKILSVLRKANPHCHIKNLPMHAIR